MVVSPDEVVHYPLFHIRSVALVKAKSNNKDGDKNNNKNNKQEDGNQNNQNNSLEEITRQIAWVRGRDERLYYANFDGDAEPEKETSTRKKAGKAAT